MHDEGADRLADMAGTPLQRTDGTPVRALVVDDEHALADAVALAFEGDGWSVRAVHRGRDVLFAAREFQPDVIVLDVMLPDIDGFEVLERLRDARDDVRVLFLTARDAPEDRLAGLTGGGDDYLTKPFGIEELLVRARILARTSVRVASTGPAGIVVGDLHLDEDARTVARAGDPLELTPTEYELLRHLARNAKPGAVAGADPRERVGHGLRRVVEPRGHVRVVPPQEARRRPGAHAADRPRRRLRAPPDDVSGMRRAGADRAGVARAPSLRWRIVGAVALLLVVTNVVVGAVTVVAFREYLVGRLDAELATAAGRVVGDGRPPGSGSGSVGVVVWLLCRAADPDNEFIGAPGQAAGTVVAVLRSGSTVLAGYTDSEGRQHGLTAAQERTLSAIDRDGTPVTVQLGALGAYRAQAVGSGGDVFVTALPLGALDSTITRLALVFGGVTLLGLLVAAWALALTVRRALRPLEHVAGVATDVAALDLERGDTDITARVAVADLTANREVGQVGTALNRLLGHVGRALTVRREAEAGMRTFVADASHELRTPIATVRAYAELSTTSTDIDAVHANVGRIATEAVRMGDLVEELLLLARLDARALAGTPPLAVDAVDLTSIVVEATMDARTTAPDHRWTLDVDDDPVIVDGDAPQLRRLVRNLLSNAASTPRTDRPSWCPCGAYREQHSPPYDSSSRTTARRSTPPSYRACSTASPAARRRGLGSTGRAASGWRSCRPWPRRTAERSGWPPDRGAPRSRSSYPRPPEPFGYAADNGRGNHDERLHATAPSRSCRRPRRRGPGVRGRPTPARARAARGSTGARRRDPVRPDLAHGADDPADTDARRDVDRGRADRRTRPDRRGAGADHRYVVLYAVEGRR